MARPFFELRITNIRDAAGVYRNMADKGAVNYARDLMRESGRIMVEELAEEAPVGKHYTFTGQQITPAKRLRDSFFFRTYIRGKQIWMRVYSNTPQRAAWVILGTRPHKRGTRTIRARRAKALAFYWARKKKSMVVKSVQHPGSLPNPFHERALRKAEPKLVKKSKQAARLTAEDMAMRFPKGMEVI